MADLQEKDKVQSTATQSNSPQTAPNADDFKAWGIDPSPSENVVTPVKPQQAEPTPSQPVVQPVQPVAEPTPVVQRKYLDKFESPEDLEKYAQEIEREKTTAITENQMVRKMLDKYLEQLSQGGVPQTTGTIEQKPIVPVSQQVVNDFDIPDELADEILNKDFKGGMRKLLGQFREYVVKSEAPRLLSLVEQRQLEQSTQQQQAKYYHDTFYQTYGEKIKAILPDGKTIDVAKPAVKMAWDSVYATLTDGQRRQVDANPALLFPKVADESIKLLSGWSGKGGSGKPVTETPKAPVLSGGGARPAPTKNDKQPTVITTADGRPAEINDPAMIDWFYKNKA